MHTQVRKDVQNVLDSAYGAIKHEQYVDLHGLSDRIIHSMSIYQEKEISDCAISIYAIDKIFKNKKYLEHKDFPAFKENILKSINSARTAIAKNNITSYMNAIKNLQTHISKFDKAVGLFEQPLLEYARTKKASRLVEHGISTSQASDLMKVPEWEVNPKVAKTTASELQPSTPMDNRKRISLTKKLFNVK